MTDTTETREARLRRVLEEAQRESVTRDRQRAGRVTLAGGRVLRRRDEAAEDGPDPFDNVPV